MAYIKILKENELIGGVDNTDVYPISSTQAIYSQDEDGKIPKGVVHPKLEDRLEDIEAKEVEIENNLNIEINRAKNAEKDLQDDIDSEEARAKAAEQALQKGLNTEAERAKNAENVLQNNINTEKSRATTAERALQDSVTAEKDRATAAEASITSALNSETARAKAAEQTNATAIANEAQRAKDAEATKVDKVAGKSLVSDTEIAKLAGLQDNSTLQAALDAKQDTLVSGKNIKTINNVSLLGSGDITIDLTLYKVVDALPTSNINADKIYLVHNTQTSGSNVYTEYMYVNSAWEVVGEYKSDVDLTPYAKTKDVNAALAEKADASSVYNKSEIDAQMQNIGRITETEIDAMFEEE